MSLRGRVAVVTGASRGVGRACALALAREGVRVALAARSERERERLPGSIHTVAAEIAAHGGEALPLVCDVRDRAALRGMVAATVERYGRLDILVCNAGAMWWRPLGETPEKRYDLMMRVNLDATFFGCQEAIPHMARGGWGHIVTMSPPVDLAQVPGRIAYLISKFGMTMIALGLAEELRPQGIAANALWPVTLIDSQATRNWELGDPSWWRKPEILADALLALLRHEPPSLTGQALLDEPFLRSEGVTDFDRYSVVRGAQVPRLEDLWDRIGHPDRARGRTGS